MHVFVSVYHMVQWARGIWLPLPYCLSFFCCCYQVQCRDGILPDVSRVHQGTPGHNRKNVRQFLVIAVIVAATSL